ncbi:MAG: hypothetical protein IJ358_01880 [Clostridia bacterium]|nr:hypothetical protein [Clostridia bacterium]
MDIREFYKSNQQNQAQNTTDNSSNSNSTHSKQDFSEYQDTINKYKDLSQQELYSELLSQATNLKSQGKLNTQMLDQLSSTLYPMLNNEQKQLLNNIIERIK